MVRIDYLITETGPAASLTECTWRGEARAPYLPALDDIPRTQVRRGAFGIYGWGNWLRGCVSPEPAV